FSVLFDNYINRISLAGSNFSRIYDGF
ncbi:hypothetical protein D047_2825B, partial [Vibrio parahaemolyticus VPTS-2010_2]